MNIIEFNRNYTKLPAEIKTAILLTCEPIRIQDQTSEFLQYDTEYKRTDLHFYHSSTGYADFPDDNYLCLVLKSDIGAIFTTLRKDNEENREKYMILKSAGIAGLYQEPRYKRQFNIIIKED